MGTEITNADTRMISNRNVLKCFTPRGDGKGDISLPNVRSHRHRTAGATDAGSVATKHLARQRVGVRWTASLALFVFWKTGKLRKQNLPFFLVEVG